MSYQKSHKDVEIVKGKVSFNKNILGNYNSSKIKSKEGKYPNNIISSFKFSLVLTKFNNNNFVIACFRHQEYYLKILSCKLL